MDRVWLSNGERAEVLLDLTGLEGDSLLLMSFGSELPQTVPGANNILWEGSILNGIDFPVLRIRVNPPTAAPVTSIPATLVPVVPYAEASATRTRTKVLAGNGMVGMGMFTINGLMFDLNVINDTVQLGSTEIWEIENISNMAHPFHIHGGSFYLLDRDGLAPPAWEQGAKDVVLVDAGENVRVIMRFDDLTEGWPFMYHCHNLLHEDNMMMAQYIVVDGATYVHSGTVAAPLSAFPSPTTSTLTYTTDFAVQDVSVLDVHGRTVLRIRGSGSTQGQVDLSSLAPGPYVLSLHGANASARLTVVRDQR
jgi:bilirubin oxidase